MRRQHGIDWTAQNRSHTAMLSSMETSFCKKTIAERPDPLGYASGGDFRSQQVIPSEKQYRWHMPKSMMTKIDSYDRNSQKSMLECDRHCRYENHHTTTNVLNLLATGCSCILPMKRPGSVEKVWRNLNLLRKAGDPLWYGGSPNFVPD